MASTMAPNLPKLNAGDVVAGRFRIVEVIGSGGFSVVYRAHQEAMNRFVALKVLKPTASHDAKLVERFRREALFASHLSHPNTITLFDYGHTDNGLCYIAMEHLVGKDLSEVVQLHEPMELKRVWKILVQCCRSLAEAHRLGLVHRDLKPENIYLCERDEQEFVKVLDFGVSKAITTFAEAGPNTMAPLTQEGTVFGTPLYMAPEQAMAESISAAVDIYALGHIAFEMVTGHAAYESCTNAMDVMLRQINDPPLALPEPWNSTPFSALITECTQKNPIHRIQSATDLLDRLMSSEFEPYADPSERPTRHPTLPRTPAIDVRDTEPSVFDREAEKIYRWELGVLEDALEECRTESEARVVVIRGQPGTGRSNLLRAFLQRQLNRPEITVLHRPGGDSGNAGLEQELSVLTGTPLRSSGFSEVKRILESLFGADAEISQAAADFDTDSAPITSLTTARDTLLTRISRPFRAESEKSTVVWGLENLERLDSLTLAFLDRFFRQLQARPAPVMLVVTVYPEDLKQRTGLLRYTQGLLQAQKPLGRQLALLPPGEQKEADSTLENLPKDMPVDGSYLGVSEPDPPTEENEYDFPDDETERLETFDDFEGVGGAFDRVLGYLAQLGDDVPLDLWKLVYARILDTELIRLVDSILSQAEKFGIVHTFEETIRFSKPGFAEMLRDSFEELDEAKEAHSKLAQLMRQYYTDPGHKEVSGIANQHQLAGEPDEAVKILMAAGDAAYRALDLDASREFYLQIQQILKSSAPVGGDLEHEKIWLRLGEIHGAFGEHGAAEDALERAIVRADSDDRITRGKAHKLLGDLASSQNRYDEALKHYEQARDAFRHLGEARPFVAVTSEMGHCALMQGRSNLAEDLSRQALEMAQKLKEPALIGRIHRHLGQVLTRRARFVEATEHLTKSLELFESENRDLEVIECLEEAGNAAFASAEYSTARGHFTRAIALGSSMHLGTDHAAHLGLARTLAADSNLTQAEAHLAEALSRAAMTQDLSRLADIHLYMADLMLADERYNEAFDHLGRVREVAGQIGLMTQSLSASIREAYVHFAQGDTAKTFEKLSHTLTSAEELGADETAAQARAHIIYLQLLEHGFDARGDTFSSLLQETAKRDFERASVLTYVFKADVECARGAWTKARELLRFAHVSAAKAGDFAAFIPIARRTYLLKKELGHLGDPEAGAGFALGAVIPPEVGTRRFRSFPRAE